MGKKRKARVDVEDLIARPWCYYCERDFDDNLVLTQHQKAKHFQCKECKRRLNTAGGLMVHMDQVHKKKLTHVDNALESRQGIEPEIFGMMGIPQQLVDAHRQNILNEFFKADAERRAKNGNPPPGQGSGESAKKQKVEEKEETPEQLKERQRKYIAERRALREAAAQGRTVPDSTSDTPDRVEADVAVGAQSVSFSKSRYDNFAADTAHKEAPTTTQPAHDHTQTESLQAVQPSNGSMQLQSHQTQGPQSSFDYMHSHTQQVRQPPYSSVHAYTHPGPRPSFDYMSSYEPQLLQPPARRHQPSPVVQNPGHLAQQMPPAAPRATPPPMVGPPGVHAIGTGHIPGAMMHSHTLLNSPSTERHPTAPTQNALQPAPGLPVRPSFGPPVFNREDMQLMHTGHVRSSVNAPGYPQLYGQPQHDQHQQPRLRRWDMEHHVVARNMQESHKESIGISRPVDNLSVDNTPAAPVPAPATSDAPATSSQKKKKSKTISMLVYNDPHESPEERRAKWGKYAV
jgi:hypothetical protein